VILVQLRPKGADATTITVHPKVTVVGGLDEAARRRLSDGVLAALRGAPNAGVEVEVDVDGQRRTLTPDLARELGLSEATATMALFALDLPGAKPAAPPPSPEPRPEPDPEPEPEPAPDPGPATRALEEAKHTLGEAERAMAAAAERLAEANASGPPAEGDDDVMARVAVLEGQLEAAQAGAAAAKRNLAQAQEAERAQSAARTAHETEAKAARDALLARHADLEASRAEIVVRMVEAGDPGDPAPVAQALEGLRRLQQVKPKPSAHAAELADRWAAIMAKLARLPQPPQPPEWLVTPALAALHEAREALAHAESGPGQIVIDKVKIEALDRAHREALDAEQKAMRKGSRLNRRRLDQAHEQESAALAALGVSSYGEYLQRIAPIAEGGSPGEDRIKQAKAALADAEAVWEELHGGQASPEWTAAKEEQAEIRTAVFALMGREIDDADLDGVLRGHLEIVVDTGWAEQELALVLGRAGADVAEGDDLEVVALAWLESSPAQRELRAALEAELAAVDEAMQVLQAQLAPPATEGGAAEAETAEAAVPSGSDPLTALAAAAAEAETAEQAAQGELAVARQREIDAKARAARVASAAGEVEARRKAVAENEAKVAEAEAALAAVNQRIAEMLPPKPKPEPKPEAAPAAASNGGADLSGVVAMEAELYVLARVAALRAAAAGPLPLLFDANAIAGLAPPAATRMLGLLERAAATVQVVVLGDDGQVGEWAQRLASNGAAVRTAAR
jgi:hypothetical protein